MKLLLKKIYNILILLSISSNIELIESIFEKLIENSIKIKYLKKNSSKLITKYQQKSDQNDVFLVFKDVLGCDLKENIYPGLTSNDLLLLFKVNDIILQIILNLNLLKNKKIEEKKKNNLIQKNLNKINNNNNNNKLIKEVENSANKIPASEKEELLNYFRLLSYNIDILSRLQIQKKINHKIRNEIIQFIANIDENIIDNNVENVENIVVDKIDKDEDNEISNIINNNKLKNILIDFIDQLMQINIFTNNSFIDFINILIDYYIDNSIISELLYEICNIFEIEPPRKLLNQINNNNNSNSNNDNFEPEKKKRKKTHKELFNDSKFQLNNNNNNNNNKNNNNKIENENNKIKKEMKLKINTNIKNEMRNIIRPLSAPTLSHDTIINIKNINSNTLNNNKYINNNILKEKNNNILNNNNNNNIKQKKKTNSLLSNKHKYIRHFSNNARLPQFSKTPTSTTIINNNKLRRTSSFSSILKPINKKRKSAFNTISSR